MAFKDLLRNPRSAPYVKSRLHRVTPKEKLKIAQAKAAGKSARQIAKEIGFSQRTIETHAAQRETKLLIERLKNEHAGSLSKLYADALKGMAVDLRSKDADTRIKTRNQVLRYITAGDPQIARIASPPGGGEFTLEELLITIRRASVTTSPVGSNP